MPVENATYLSQLNPDWPVGKSDFVSEGDDHFRMMKKSIQNTIPNANAPITGTPTQLNNLTNGINWIDNSATAGAASYFEVTDPTSTDDTKPDAPLVVGTPTVEQYNATPGLATNWNLLTDVIYAVGKYYESETDNRNPADILGFGTWEARTGLVYGVGAVSDKEQVDTDGNALTYTFAAGPVAGRLYVTGGNIAPFDAKGSTGTPNADDPDTLDPDGEHQHHYSKMNENNPKDGDYNNAGGTSTDTLTTGDATHIHETHTTVGEMTEPFIMPGYACYRWVRTA